MPEPRVIYEAKPGSPIAVDRPFYDRLATETRSRTLVERFVIPMRSGRAWPVRAGQLFRIVAVEGPQVADFNAWNLDNPRERFWAARTKQLHRAHVTTYDRLWSCLPYLRPMLTITNDSIRYGATRTGRAVTTCSAPAATRTCTRCSTARTSISPATRTWCARSPPTVSTSWTSTTC